MILFILPVYCNQDMYIEYLLLDNKYIMYVRVVMATICDWDIVRFCLTMELHTENLQHDLFQ